MKDIIMKRTAELKKGDRTWICFEDRYLLEGRVVGLEREGEEMKYIGERLIDYETDPPHIIEIVDNIICGDLEKLFTKENEKNNT